MVWATRKGIASEGRAWCPVECPRDGADYSGCLPDGTWVDKYVFLCDFFSLSSPIFGLFAAPIQE